MNDEQILLSVADGPEEITIYTSEEKAIVACANYIPGLFVRVQTGMNTYIEIGPFGLSKNLIEQLNEKIK